LVDDYQFDYCQKHGEAPYLQRKGQPRVYCKTSQNVCLIAASMQIKAVEVALSTPVGAPSEAVGGAAQATQEKVEEDVIDESLNAIFDEAEIPVVEVAPPPPLVHKKVAKKKDNKRLGEERSSQGIPASHFLIHFPKDPRCEICNHIKMQFSKHRATKHKAECYEDEGEVPKVFGDKGTADHMIMGKDEQPVGKHTVALVVLDRATRFMGAYPAVTNSTQTTVAGLQSFYSTAVPKLIHSDNSGELRKACDVLNYSQDTTTPHRPQSNGVAIEGLGDAKKELHVKCSSQASWSRGGIGQCQHSVRSTTSQKRLWSKVANDALSSQVRRRCFFLKR
jgi:hypothetical protein